MSYQAITDIIVKPVALQDLQLSNTVKDSPKISQDNSFAELVSFYKKEDTADVNESSASEVSFEKKEVSKDENKVEETKSEEKVKKNDTDSDKKEKIDSKSEKNESAKTKLDNQISKTESVSVDSDNSEKIQDNSKKLSKKDFSRMEEIAEKDPVLDDVSKFAVNIQNNLNENSDVKVEKELKVDAEMISVDENQTLAANIQINSNVETDAKDFNFERQEPTEKKQLTLDKTGKITVEDQRTEKAEEVVFEKRSDLKITDIKQTNENTAVMTMDLNQDVNADVLSLNSQTASSNGSNFQAMLNNQIQNSAPEFVKAGNLILKDNNQGTINLVIHPDDLGNVKIHLSLDGKNVTGHITVATKEALQVFKDNAETLREAFIKSGFDGASFDVTFSNGGAFNQNLEFAQKNDGSDIFAKNVYKNNGGSLDSELEAIFENSEDISNYSVNIIA